MKNVSKATNNKTANLEFLIVMIALMLFQTNDALAENDVSDPLISPKIINGVPSKKGEWHWMAALLKTNSVRPPYRRQFCGGTLVAPQWVLTAAHCAEAYSGMEVLLGENDLKGTGGEIIPVAKIIVHPDYKAEDVSADLALLYLESPSSIEPVSLAKNFDFQRERGNFALAIGWGITSQSIFSQDVIPTNLHQVELIIETNSTCDNPNLPKNVICLGVFEKKTACKGDSGGPLLIFDSKSQSRKQIGITSFGYAYCTSLGGFGIYTQIDKYKQFIDSTINSTQETPEEFLAKCVNKYPAYVGRKSGEASDCGINLSEVCQNTTGGSLMNITQIAVLRNNKDEMLQYFDASSGVWNEISYSDLGYCD